MSSPSEADRDRFAEWFMRSQRELYVYILSVVPDLNEADEIFQETGMVLWKKHQLLESYQHFLRFAFGTARKCILSYLSHKSRDRHVFSETLLERLADVRSENPVWQERRTSALNQCLQKLDAARRRLIQRFYAPDEANSELAAELGISENALYQRAHRIRGTLMECIERTLGEGDAT